MKLLIQFTTSLFVYILVVGCAHKNIEHQLGPSYCSEYTTKLSTNRSGEADFKIEGDTIMAVISGGKSWKIKITGLTSKAVKYFDGNSNVINQLWFGENDSTQMFVSGEQCRIDLNVNCQPIQSTLVTLKSEPDFSKTGYFVTGFEVLGESSMGPVDGEFLLTSINKINGVQETNSSITALQGSHYYRFAGTAKTWFIGNVSFGVDSTQFQSAFGEDVSAEDVNVSFWVNFNGLKTAKLTVAIREQLCPNAGECRTLDILNNDGKTGWFEVTKKLSDFGVKGPHGIMGINFKPGPLTISQDIDISIDLIRFSKVKK